jgi:hypothetical protein
VKDPGYRTPAYQDVLRRLRNFAGLAGTFDIMQARQAMAAATPGARDPHGRPSRLYLDQVLRAAGALVAEGTLVKSGAGRNARYRTPDAHKAYLDETERAAAERSAHRETWQQVKTRLDLHEFTDISRSPLDIRLSLGDWVDLVGLLDRAVSSPAAGQPEAPWDKPQHKTAGQLRRHHYQPSDQVGHPCQLCGHGWRHPWHQ